MSGHAPAGVNPFAALFNSSAQPPVNANGGEAPAEFPLVDAAANLSTQKDRGHMTDPDEAGGTLHDDVQKDATSDLIRHGCSADNNVEAQLQLSYYYERVLLTTLDCSNVAVGTGLQRPQYCVFLSDLRESLQQDWIDLDIVGQVLFERLVLPDPCSCMVEILPPASSRSFSATEAIISAARERRVMTLIYQSFQRTVSARLGMEYIISADTVSSCQDAIIGVAATCLLQPDIFEGQAPAEQLADIIVNGYSGDDADTLQMMLNKLVPALQSADISTDGLTSSTHQADALRSVFEPLLLKVWKDCSRLCAGQLPTVALSGACTAGADVLVLFTKQPSLGELLVEFSTPKPAAGGATVQGCQYEQSLLGLLLSGSSMPSRNSVAPLQLYSDVSQLTQAEINSREAGTWQGLVRITEKAYDLFYSLLRLSPVVKHRLLNWIGSCLHANAGRAKLSATLYDDEGGGSGVTQDCSDGFMLNLSALLLRLCKPFVAGSSELSDARKLLLLRIQPQYCLYEYGTDDDKRAHCHHSSGLVTQTCLVPREDALSLLPEPAEYTGITEFYFMAQTALHLGFHTAVEKFFKVSNDLSRLQGVYQQVRQNAASGGSGTGREAAIKAMFENEMRKFLCMKASLTEPGYLEACLRFHAASATYLVHLAAHEDAVDGQEQRPTTLSTGAALQLPLPRCSHSARARLSCIPEFVITNIADTLTLVRRFKEPVLQVLGSSSLGCIMDVILVFMGSKDRLKNPHLRAKLAIVLEDLLPMDVPAGGSSFASSFSGLQYEQLFTSHRNIVCLSETLINVFVSIEMTGEGVRFEEKFNYRRPMYKVIDYMWGIDLHKRAIKELCKHAEEHMSDVDPPLFLRFINLLVNDAIYLLDEGLSYMRQIREKEEEQNTASLAPGGTGGGAPDAEVSAPERRRLMEQQRQQREQEANAHHMSMLARFHNMLGADTIHTLALLTSECQSIFCHAVMADRVAAMLNYFLLHLTGPNTKQFKVKNFEKYDFKPKLVVSDICQIYLNLGQSQSFCSAVSGDGRSYSASLFPQAARVLGKIGKPVDMIEAFCELAQRIQAVANRQMEEDACLGEAPEEFLDPIMGTLMRDPVILPSSRVTVDRSTIARHILSDQTDPFNRSPLSMDMIEPNTALLVKINAWLGSKLPGAVP